MVSLAAVPRRSAERVAMRGHAASGARYPPSQHLWALRCSWLLDRLYPASLLRMPACQLFADQRHPCRQLPPLPRTLSATPALSQYSRAIAMALGSRSHASRVDPGGSASAMAMLLYPVNVPTCTVEFCDGVQFKRGGEGCAGHDAANRTGAGRTAKRRLAGAVGQDACVHGRTTGASKGAGHAHPGMRGAPR